MGHSQHSSSLPERTNPRPRAHPRARTSPSEHRTQSQASQQAVTAAASPSRPQNDAARCAGAGTGSGGRPGGPGVGRALHLGLPGPVARPDHLCGRPRACAPPGGSVQQVGAIGGLGLADGGLQHGRRRRATAGGRRQARRRPRSALSTHCGARLAAAFTRYLPTLCNRPSPPAGSGSSSTWVCGCPRRRPTRGSRQTRWWWAMWTCTIA